MLKCLNVVECINAKMIEWRRCRDRKENISWQIRFADIMLMKRKLN